MKLKQWVKDTAMISLALIIVVTIFTLAHINAVNYDKKNSEQRNTLTSTFIQNN